MAPTTHHVDVEDLLAHSDWLTKLARHLAGPGAEADDLVQDTWLAAIRSAPDRGRSPRPWLVKVMHNLRRMYARGDIRRRTRETVMAPVLGSTTAPDTQALAERVELQRLVARLVLQLDEPYKTTVLLRFYEGLSSPELGRVLGVPEGTVRWRLKEALARIRRCMDEQHPSANGDWRAVLLPLAPPAPAGGLGKGALVMATKSKSGALALLVSVLAVLAGGSWWIVQRQRPPTPSAGAPFDTPEIDRGRLRVFGAQAVPNGPRVAGRVLDPAGNGVRGADLTVIRQRQDARPGEPMDPRPRATATSDQTGEFLLELPGPGAYVVTATAPGLLPARADVRIDDPETTRLELRLGRGGIAVRGKVHDSGGGPIARAEVRAAGLDLGLAQARTDASGAYELRLPPGRYDLLADADGYAPERKGVEALSDLEQSFRLNPAARLAGRVVEKATGAAVAGALVRAAVEGPFSVKEATSNSEGGFEFEDLDPGRYLISAAKGNLAGFLAAPAPVALAASIPDVVVTLESAFVISGQVRDAVGKPAPSAQIRMDEMRGADLGIVEGKLVAVADAGGRYRVAGVLPGRLRVGADAAPHAPAEGKMVVVKDKDIAGLDFVLPEGGELRGQVLTHEGAPVPEAEVIATVQANDNMDAPIRSGRRRGRAGADGRFVIGGLGAGRLTITAQHLRLGKAVVGPQSLGPGERKELTIRLMKPAFISGMVRHDDRAPAAGVRVRWDARGSRSPDRLSVTTETDGSFRVGPASPGSGTLKAEPMSASRGSFGPPEGANEKSLSINEGQDIAGIELVLPRYDKTIAGVALGPDGKPLEGATVGAEIERDGRSGRPAWMIQHQGSKYLSDAEGHFTIGELKRSRYTVWGFHPRFPLVEVGQVEAGASDVRLRFRPGASLAGTAVGPDGEPVSRYDVQVIPAEGPNLGEGRHVGGMEEGTRRTVNSPGGAFDVGGLQAGRYDVLVTTVDGGAGRLAGVSLREGESRRGLRVVVARSLRLRGRVVDLETGTPIPNIGVGMTRTREHVHTRTDASGSFVIERLVPGRTIVINVRGTEPGGHVGETREITLPEGKTEVEIAPFRLLPVPRWDGGSRAGSVGLSLSSREGPPTVMEVLPDSPASRAGVVPGTVIRSIDGKEVTGYGRTATILVMRGAPGSAVTLTLESPQGSRRTVTLVREEQGRP